MVCRVVLRLGRAPGGGSVCKVTLGLSVPFRRETLIAVCQLAGMGAAALILPCYLLDLAFDTDLLSMLAQAALAGFACALMVAVWADQEKQLAINAKQARASVDACPPKLRLSATRSPLQVQRPKRCTTCPT